MIDDLGTQVAWSDGDRRRLDLLAMLVTATVGVVIVAEVFSVYRQMGSFVMDADLTDAFRRVPLSLGIGPALVLVVPYVVVVIGRSATARATGTLRLLVVVGLLVCLLWGYAAVDVLAHPNVDAAVRSISPASARSVPLLTNLLTIVPVVIASVLAGYLAWSAFQALAPAGDLGGSEPGDPTEDLADADVAIEAPIGSDPWAPPPADPEPAA